MKGLKRAGSKGPYSHKRSMIETSHRMNCYISRNLWTITMMSGGRGLLMMANLEVELNQRSRSDITSNRTIAS